MEKKVYERIQMLLKYQKISPHELAKILGINPQSVYNYLAGTSKAPMSFVLMILESFPDVSAEWLLRGDGKMLIRDEKQRSYIERAAQEAGMQYAAEEEPDKDQVFSKLFDVVTHRLDEQAQKVHELAKQLDDMKSILYK